MFCNNGIYTFSNNQLSGFLPTQGLPSTAFVNVNDNYCNFDGLEPAVTDYTKMNLSGNSISQNQLPLHQNGNKLSVYAGGTLSNNKYFWYKNNVLVQTKIGDSTFTYSRAGTYKVTIENTVLGFYSRLYSTSIVISSSINMSNSNVTLCSISPNPAND